jgi:hypothetical protein
LCSTRQVSRDSSTSSKCSGENVKVHEDGCDGIAAVCEQTFRCLLVVGHVVGVEEQGGLSDGNEVLKEALAAVDEA